jgi:SAM-dependent methyltransferase
LLESRLAGFWNPDYFQRVILPLLSLRPGARLLDVGSGTGSFTLLLAQLLPEIRVVGLDVTSRLVREAQAKAQEMDLENVEFREGDALHLPFPSDAFDAAVCQTVLAYLTDPAGVVREMSRVLLGGGIFLAAEYHTLNAEWPIDPERMDVTDGEAVESTQYTRMLIRGFRNSGQGDLRMGGKVAFLAQQAGLEVIDVRINDRVLHAFPPYASAAQQAARAEARACVATYADAQWRAWVASAMTAGGGTLSDVDKFLSLLPNRQRDALSAERGADYSFIWLLNPVLLVTIARKPLAGG